MPYLSQLNGQPIAVVTPHRPSATAELRMPVAVGFIAPWLLLLVTSGLGLSGDDRTGTVLDLGILLPALLSAVVFRGRRRASAVRCLAGSAYALTSMVVAVYVWFCFFGEFTF